MANTTPCPCVLGPETTCPVHGPAIAADLQAAMDEREERAQAANLWERLVTLWESHDYNDSSGTLIGEVAQLVDEWHGFVGKKGCANMKPSEFVYCNESIPHHMWEALTGYIERHEPVGHFLRALLSNDLREACVRADNSNIRVLHVYVAYLDSHADPGCWGSPEKVAAWLAEGFAGKEPA